MVICLKLNEILIVRITSQLSNHIEFNLAIFACHFFVLFSMVEVVIVTSTALLMLKIFQPLLGSNRVIINSANH